MLGPYCPKVKRSGPDCPYPLHQTPLTSSETIHNTQSFYTPYPQPLMDITGHFESASCVVEVHGDDTLADVKGKLLAELGVPRTRRVGVRMRGGGDIGDDKLRICDTEMDEGCAVELYCTGASIAPGVIPRSEDVYDLRLSPCNGYLAVSSVHDSVSIFDTETQEELCSISAVATSQAFSPCSEWITSINGNTHCVEVHCTATGVLQHTFGEDTADGRETTAWSSCGAKVLSSCEGLEVWDIATGDVHEYDLGECKKDVVINVVGDKVAVFGSGCEHISIWDYMTGEKVLVLTAVADVDYVAVTPDQRFIAACADTCVQVWNIETGECVFKDVSENNYWSDVAVCNDAVAACTSKTLRVWSIASSELLWQRAFDGDKKYTTNYGVAISSCGDVVMYGGTGGVHVADISDLL